MRLALDLGTRTGWARETAEGVAHGYADFRPGKYDGAGMRYLRFQRWLDTVSEGVTEVHFEAVRRHIGTDAAHVYGGLMATLQAWCETKGIPYAGKSVQAIKKSWTGRGNADKQSMIDEAKRRGFAVSSDDEADAIALLHLVKEVG